MLQTMLRRRAKVVGPWKAIPIILAYLHDPIVLELNIISYGRIAHADGPCHSHLMITMYKCISPARTRYGEQSITCSPSDVTDVHLQHERRPLKSDK